MDDKIKTILDMLDLRFVFNMQVETSVMQVYKYTSGTQESLFIYFKLESSGYRWQFKPWTGI